MKISITGTETVNSMPSYTVYCIESRFVDNADPIQVKRRYNDFKWLSNYIEGKPCYQGLLMPRLPEKKIIGNMKSAFVEQRKIDFDIYLKQISRHQILQNEEAVRVFLGKGGDFQKFKEAYPLKSFSLKEWDSSRIKEAYEYAVTYMWNKIIHGSPYPVKEPLCQ